MDYSQDNTMNESSASDVSHSEFGSAAVDVVLMRMLKSAGLLLMHAINEESVNHS
uniref:Transcriptional regulator n=1 Tax=Ascaris lumbricoides TaxID=6252 RepID=A0A0M3IJC7_ASCLU